MPIPFSIIITAVGALAAVLGLVLLAARIAGATSLGRSALPARGRARRLSVQESLPVDRNRRLVIVRCDGRDLLLVTGGPTDLMVGWLANPQDSGACA